jgi:hypothetical protein
MASNFSFIQAIAAKRHIFMSLKQKNAQKYGYTALKYHGVAILANGRFMLAS